MARNTTVGANIRRIHELGYAIASATNSDRLQNLHYSDCGRQKKLWALKDDPAAVLTYPTPFYAPELQDEDKPADTARTRGIVLLVVTDYLLSDPRQSKAVMPVLERYKLTSGPFQIDSSGTRTYPLQWNDHEPLFEERAARNAYPDDDPTVIFKQQAVPPTRYSHGVNMMGFPTSAPLDEIGSHILWLEGEWKQGHLLDTPRRNLPELLRDDIPEIVGDVERARWGARPAANAKEAA